MKVFTDTWTAFIRNRYGKRPAFDRPPIFDFVIGERWAKQREDIETWVDELDELSQAKVIGKVQGHTKELAQIIDIYHELAFGHALIQLGYEIEYEKTLGGAGITPDWHVHQRQDIPDFILEITTKNRSDATSLAFTAQNHLYGLLGQIPVDVLLDIDTKPNYIFSKKANKEIYLKIQEWLTTISPFKGAKLDLGGITFKVVQMNLGKPKVRFIGPSRVFFVNPQPLGEMIKQKVKKYKHLDMPLVVGLTADPLTGYSVEEVIDVLFGTEVYSLEDGLQSRLSDGLAQKLPNLSAVIWLNSVFTDREFHVVSNPSSNALHPLPQSTWEKVSSF